MTAECRLSGKDVVLEEPAGELTDELRPGKVGWGVVIDCSYLPLRRTFEVMERIGPLTSLIAVKLDEKDISGIPEILSRISELGVKTMVAIGISNHITDGYMKSKIERLFVWGASYVVIPAAMSEEVAAIIPFDFGSHAAKFFVIDVSRGNFSYNILKEQSERLAISDVRFAVAKGCKNIICSPVHIDVLYEEFGKSGPRFLIPVTAQGSPWPLQRSLYEVSLKASLIFGKDIITAPYPKDALDDVFAEIFDSFGRCPAPRRS